jgi:hypothetical protein
MHRLVFACLAAAAVHPAALAADGWLTLSAGADHSSGTYGQQATTEVSSLSFTAKYELGPWTYRLSLPLLRISGPANVVGAGPDIIVLPGQADARRSVSGLGDLVASAAYNLVGGSTGALVADVAAKVKLATAEEEKGLGTGKNDYSLQADLFFSAPPVAPFATLGYRWYGDPAGTELRNALFGSLGFAYRDAAATTLGVSYDFRQRIVAGGAPLREAMLFISRDFTPGLKLQLYFIKGFSDASPDAGVGAIAARRF